MTEHEIIIAAASSFVTLVLVWGVTKLKKNKFEKEATKLVASLNASKLTILQRGNKLFETKTTYEWNPVTRTHFAHDKEHPFYVEKEGLPLGQVNIEFEMPTKLSEQELELVEDYMQSLQKQLKFRKS